MILQIITKNLLIYNLNAKNYILSPKILFRSRFAFFKINQTHYFNWSDKEIKMSENVLIYTKRFT